MKCINKEIVNIFLAFDNFINVVLKDVTEFEFAPEGRLIN